MTRHEIIGRMLMMSNDIRVREDPDLHDAARALECVALLMFHERERSVLDCLVKAITKLPRDLVEDPRDRKEDVL